MPTLGEATVTRDSDRGLSLCPGQSVSRETFRPAGSWPVSRPSKHCNISLQTALYKPTSGIAKSFHKHHSKSALASQHPLTAAPGGSTALPPQCLRTQGVAGSRVLAGKQRSGLSGAKVCALTTTPHLQSHQPELVCGESWLCVLRWKLP